MDFFCSGAVGNIKHHQHFQQVFANGWYQRLDDEYYSTAYAGAKLDVHIIIAKTTKCGGL